MQTTGLRIVVGATVLGVGGTVSGTVGAPGGVAGGVHTTRRQVNCIGMKKKKES